MDKYELEKFGSKPQIDDIVTISNTANKTVQLGFIEEIIQNKEGIKYLIKIDGGSVAVPSDVCNLHTIEGGAAILSEMVALKPVKCLCILACGYSVME